MKARVSCNGGLPIRFYLTEEMMPDAETLAQLEGLARTPGLEQYVSVLPDIHRKGRNPSPTGTVVVSRSAIVPRAIDSGVNCGIRMLQSDIDVADLSPDRIDRLYAELMHTIPVQLHERPVWSREDVEEILVAGGSWSRRTFGLDDAELGRIEDGATVHADTRDPGEILASVPDKAIKRGQRCLGTIGGGNHFLELQQIVEVLDADAASLLGLKLGKAMFMLHTGSRAVGSKTIKPLVAEHENGDPRSSVWALSADSEAGVRFARAAAAVANFGFANRIAITEKLRAAVRHLLDDEKIDLPLLYDCGHVGLKRELWNNEWLWVHRHGASRALPGSMLAADPVLSVTGQPVPLPGSMGDCSYVGVTEECAVETFGSVNHGAGRLMDKPEAAESFTTDQVERELRDRQIRLYRYGVDNVAEQAPRSFKNITAVVQAMRELKLARPIVRLKPIAVLKG